MAMKINIWNADTASKEIRKRFQHSSKDRAYEEPAWKASERTIYSTGRVRNALISNQSLDFSLTEALANVDQSNANVNTSYTMKNLRYIHAQMSSNPPVVAMRPTTSDQDDHRKADAADRIVRWCLRKYQLQENQDQCNLHALAYGTGFIKTVWDAAQGDIIAQDPESGEIILEGDIDISIPFIWNMYLDPDAKQWDQVKWVIEKIYMDYDEACLRWPDKIDELKGARVEENTESSPGYSTELRNFHYNCVELFEYWEKGLPTNGYMGRYCLTTRSFDVVDGPRPSPFRFTRAGASAAIEKLDLPEQVRDKRIKNLPEQADLPYHMLSDIDVPNVVWGKSSVEYAANLQNNLNRLDSATLDNVEAHGVARMVLPEATEISEDALSNSPWDVVKITGNQPPFFIKPPDIMPVMTQQRTNYIQGINDVMGTNESMFGQQSREQSGASMQYATNQGNMIRRRLFNKYVTCVESVYRGLLNLIRKHWSTTRTIHVIGKENALEASDIKGADIDGGYDIIGEYGVTLSLDPITRREELLTLQPLFKEAGVPTRTLMRMMKLNEVEGIFDELEFAENRQKEIFDRMIASGAYEAPEEQMDHENMIAFALHYFMTQEFDALSPDIKALLKQHNKARGQLAATEASGGGRGGAPAGGAPGGAQPPAPGSMPSPTSAPSVAPQGALPQTTGAASQPAAPLSSPAQ